MNYEDLAAALKKKGLDNGASLGSHSVWHEAASYAITDLLEENDKLKNELRKCQKNADNWKKRWEKESELRKEVERQRDEISDSINNWFKYWDE